LRTGSIDKACELFKETLKSQDEWQQLANACYENLMWTYAAQLDWDRACFYARKLTMSVTRIREAHWFQLATFLDMKWKADLEKGLETKGGAHEVGHLLEKTLSEQDDGDEIDTLSRHILLTAERFVLKPEDIPLPAYMLLYLNNMFGIIKECPEKLVQVQDSVKKKAEEILKRDNLIPELDDTNGPSLEDYLTLKFLSGLCFQALKKPVQATELFKEVLQRKSRLEPSSPLAGLAMLELGLSLIASEEPEDGRFWLKATRIECPNLVQETVYLTKLERGMELSDDLESLRGDAQLKNQRRRSSIGLDNLKNMASKLKSNPAKQAQRNRRNSIGLKHTDLL
jgi:hypothetical protein